MPQNPVKDCKYKHSTWGPPLCKVSSGSVFRQSASRNTSQVRFAKARVVALPGQWESGWPTHPHSVFCLGFRGSIVHPAVTQKGTKTIRAPELAGNWADGPFGGIFPFPFPTAHPLLLHLLLQSFPNPFFWQTQFTSSTKRTHHHTGHSLLLLVISCHSFFPQIIHDNSLTFLSRSPSTQRRYPHILAVPHLHCTYRKVRSLVDRTHSRKIYLFFKKPFLHQSRVQSSRSHETIRHHSSRLVCRTSSLAAIRETSSGSGDGI